MLETLRNELQNPVIRISCREPTVPFRNRRWRRRLGPQGECADGSFERTVRGRPRPERFRRIGEAGQRGCRRGTRVAQCGDDERLPARVARRVEQDVGLDEGRPGAATIEPFVASVGRKSRRTLDDGRSSSGSNDERGRRGTEVRKGDEDASIVDECAPRKVETRIGQSVLAVVSMHGALPRGSIEEGARAMCVRKQHLAAEKRLPVGFDGNRPACGAARARVAAGIVRVKVEGEDARTLDHV